MEQKPLLTKEILQKVRQIEVRTNRLVNDSFAGSYQSVFKGRGMNFEDVREYIAGDDIRTIDWNVTARTGTAHIKKFTEERELTIMLIIDISSSGDFGSTIRSKREMMAEIASVLAFSAVKNSDRVGLLLFTDSIELYIPAGKGRSHILRIIREILFFTPQNTQSKTDINCALDFASTVIKRRCVAFLLSDFCLPGDFDTALKKLRPRLQIMQRRHDCIALSISDKREYRLPDIGWITLEDAESGEQIEVNTASPSLRNAFAKQAGRRQQQVFDTLRTCGIDLLDLATDKDYLPPLKQFFGVRERRR